MFAKSHSCAYVGFQIKIRRKALVKIDLKEQMIQTVETVVSRLIFQVAHALLSFMMWTSVEVFFLRIAYVK